MQQKILDANAKVNIVRQILADYVQNCGCINTSMCDLRDAFAEVFDPRAPDFHFHFSTLARTAIAEDIRRGQKGYPIGGTMSADYDVMVGDPVILPGKSVFHDSRDVFKRARDRESIISKSNQKPTASTSS